MRRPTVISSAGAKPESAVRAARASSALRWMRQSIAVHTESAA